MKTRILDGLIRILKDKDIVEYEYHPSPLPRDLRPGEVITLRSVVRAPVRPGNFTLVWDFNDKKKGWFIDQEHLPVTLDLPVMVEQTTDGKLVDPNIALWVTLDITSRCISEVPSPISSNR